MGASTSPLNSLILEHQATARRLDPADQPVAAGQVLDPPPAQTTIPELGLVRLPCRTLELDKPGKLKR